MKFSNIGLITLLTLSSAACTQQGAYGGLQAGQRNECQKMPEATAREQCLRDADKSYDQYQKERAEVLQKDR